MAPKVALFDICGTLFRSNTTFDFLDFYIKKTPYRFFRIVMRCHLWRWFNSLIYRAFAVDLSRRIALSYLKGYSHSQLRGMALFFYENYLENRKIEPVWQLLEDCRNRNCEIVLISGTIDPVAEVVAQKVAAQRFVSSRLWYDEANVCCGKLAYDALLTKSKELRKLGVQSRYELLVTDNPGDLSMADGAKNIVIIAHRNEKRWKRMTRHLDNVKILSDE